MSIRNRITRLENVTQGQASEVCLCPRNNDWAETTEQMVSRWLSCPNCHKPKMPPDGLAQELADVLNQIYGGDEPQAAQE